MRGLGSPTLPPQPCPPPPPLATFKLPMLYYGLVVVGTAALVLLLYNLIIIKWCANVGLDHHGPRQGRSMVRARFVEEAARGGQSFEYSQGSMLASFSYKKDAAKDGFDTGRSSDYECAVCLSVFEQGEEVRRLPRCSHSFHASCIDMWLYSHCDCPLCRTPVVEPLLCHMNSGEHSREGLMIGSVVSV